MNDAVARLERAFEIYKKKLQEGDAMTYAVVENFALHAGVEDRFYELVMEHKVPVLSESQKEAAFAAY